MSPRSDEIEPLNISPFAVAGAKVMGRLLCNLISSLLPGAEKDWDRLKIDNIGLRTVDPRDWIESCRHAPTYGSAFIWRLFSIIL